MVITTRTLPTRQAYLRIHLLSQGPGTWPSTSTRKTGILELTRWGTYVMVHGRELTSMGISRHTRIASALTVLWINRVKSWSITTRSDSLTGAGLPRLMASQKPAGRSVRTLGQCWLILSQFPCVSRQPQGQFRPPSTKPSQTRTIWLNFSSEQRIRSPMSHKDTKRLFNRRRSIMRVGKER